MNALDGAVDKQKKIKNSIFERHRLNIWTKTNGQRVRIRNCF